MSGGDKAWSGDAPANPFEGSFERKRIGFLGAGAIGSAVGGLLSRDGHDVTLVDPWWEHIEAVRANGLTVKTAHDNGEVVTHPTAIHFKDLSGVDEMFDIGVIAVNGYDTAWAAKCLDARVKPGGFICCMQNGVNDDVIAGVVGEQRTLGVVVTISAAVYDPGVVLRTDLNPHCFKVGELNGEVSDRALEVAAMLTSAVGPAAVTTNLLGQRWSKLVVNCMNNGLAGLTGWKTAETRMHPDTQRVGIQLAAEVVRVARARGITVEGVMGLSPDAIVAAADGCGAEAARAQLAQMAAKAGGESRPSFGQDVLKGRRTEVNELNGHAAAWGRRVGVPTPFCDKITEIVTSLGVGFKPSPDHVKPLVDMVNALEAEQVAVSAATTATTDADAPPPPLRVAVVGCGYFAQFHLEAWARLDGVTLTAVCDRDLAKAEQAVSAHGRSGNGGAQAFDDAVAMLASAKPDVLDIVTPPETHHALVALACDHGVPTVVCQKPLAPTLDEAAAIVELAESRGVKLVVHENFRHQPWHREIRGLVHGGAVGTVLNVTFRLRPGDGQGSPPAYAKRQPYFLTMERFLVHETGVHLVDVFRALLGEVRVVSADLRRLNPAGAGEDAATVVFGFGNGVNTGVRVAPCVSPCVTAVLDCNRLVDHDADDTRLTMGEMLVEGTDGAIRLDGRGRVFLRGRAPAPEQEHVYAWRRSGFGGDCVHETQRHIVDHLRSGAPLHNSGREFLCNVAVEEAIYRSAAASAAVPLPLGAPTVVAAHVGGDVRAELGEGPIWDGRRQVLLWVDIIGARVFETDPATGITRAHDLSDRTRHVTTVVPCDNDVVAGGSGGEKGGEGGGGGGGGVGGPGVSGSSAGGAGGPGRGLVVVATTEGVALFDLDTGAYTPHPSSGSLHSGFTRMNDGKADPQGRLWFGSVVKEGWAPLAPTVRGGAKLFCLDGWAGTPVEVVSDVTIANGLAWTPDGTRMFWIDSGKRGVDVFDWEGASKGSPATNRRPALPDLTSPSCGCIPDGCCLDTEGMLWVAVYGAGEVRRVDPATGALRGVVRLPPTAGVELTACAFGGPDLDELFITTAAKEYTAERRAELPLGGALFRVSREALGALGEGIRGVSMGSFRVGGANLQAK